MTHSALLFTRCFTFLPRLNVPNSLQAFILVALAMLSPMHADAANLKPDGTQYVSRAALATTLAAETHLPIADIRAILKQATFQPEIVKRMNGQWEAQPYVKYRPLFIKPSMRSKGRLYLQENRDVFAAVEDKYQVDAAIVAAILGIETRFGQSHGKHPILNSLYTLSTGFPRRAKFFRQQLGAIIQISRQDKLDLSKLKGSYAGAFGSIQFIPTSFRDYAVDADGDGIRDVFHSKPDIIASIANYFKRHHWQYGRPTAYWLPLDTKLNSKWKKISTGKLKLWVTLAELRQAMPKAFAAIPSTWHDDDKVSIIAMQTDKGQQLALVHYNFYVIMRYNPSFNYAMAVTEIAAMLERTTFAVD